MTRKMKKAEVARLKAEEAAARERHQAMEKARTAEKLEADQAKEAEARLADGDFADEVEHDYRFVPPQAVFEIKRGTDPDRILDLKYATPKRVY